MEAKKKIPLTFITGNKKKLEEFIAIMSDELSHYYTVDSKEIDCSLSPSLPFLVDELQGEPEFIASKKAKLASHHVPNPIIIDDVSLCFNALHGLPGPYM